MVAAVKHGGFYRFSWEQLTSFANTATGSSRESEKKRWKSFFGMAAFQDEGGGGEEGPNPLVIDCGGATCKVGWAGDELATEFKGIVRLARRGDQTHLCIVRYS